MRFLRRDRLGLGASQTQRMIAWQLTPGHALVDIGWHHLVRCHSDAGEEVETARARGREYQPHQGYPGGPARPGMKR